MTDLSYNVVYKGSLLEGHDFDGVRDQLVAKFALSLEKAEQLLKSKRMIIKKNLDQAAAKKIGLALKKAGLNVVLVQTIPPTESERSATQPPGAKPPPYTAPEEEDDEKDENEKQKDVVAVSEPEKNKPIEKTPKKALLPFEFNGTGSEYFKIWIVNIILSILTLGIYSAWAKVRRKQYLYGNTRLQNTSFEYLADPVKILKGRAIVFVFFICYSVISEFLPLLGAVLSLLFLLILPWLVVQSLAFNARNSSYRNISFGFNGTVKEACKVYLLWPILVPFTLGILFPYVYFRQKKFMVENSSYGKSQFTFKAVPKDYYNLLFKGLIPIILGLILVIGAAFVLPIVSGLIGLVFYLYLFAYFSVKSTNLLYNSTRLAANQFKADLNPVEYLILVATNTLGMVFTLGIFYPWAQVRMISYKLDHLELASSCDLNDFIAQEQKQVSAFGDEASDFFDLDIGF